MRVGMGTVGIRWREDEGKECWETLKLSIWIDCRLWDFGK